MGNVYILYSKNLDSYYIGSCENLNDRIVEHNTAKYQNAFTSKSNDWCLFFYIEDLEFSTTLKIEMHIKKMKSRKYIENLKRYPELKLKLIEKYRDGSSR